MKNLRLQKKLTARILKVGKNKVWIDPDRMEDIKEAITSEDIRELIRDKAIKKKLTKGVKARAGAKRKKRKKKGRKRRTGRIKKRINKRKQKYVKNIRKLRNYLKSIRKQNKISSKEHNKLKKLIKAGYLTSKKNIEEYITKK
jgi:large subunit ribosomal protein L19e